MTDEQIKERHNEIYCAQQKLESELKHLAFEEGKNRFEEKYPIGSILRTKGGKEYLITNYNRYWLIGCQIKKDGTPSEREQTIYSYDLDDQEGANKCSKN